jgi:hypothetical protein
MKPLFKGLDTETHTIAGGFGLSRGIRLHPLP